MSELNGKAFGHHPRVYLAGKIAKRDWRHDIFKDLRSSGPDYPPANVDGFAYAGPFFVSCDHGCYHGAGSHGVGAPSGDGCESGDWGISATSPTHILCRDWLASADVVFAYIDGPNPYGTILELGIAAAMKIPVFLAFGLPEPRFDAYGEPVGVYAETADSFPSPTDRLDAVGSAMRDMWLAGRFAEECDVFGSSSLAWASFKRWFSSRLATAQLLDGGDR